MAAPRVIDNDRDEITVTLDGQEIRGWSYANEAERRTKMLAAREFCEGWHSAWNRRAARPAVKALDQMQYRYLNGEGGKFTAWRDGYGEIFSEMPGFEIRRSPPSALVSAPADRPIHTALPNYAGWRSIDTAPEDCRVILAAAGNWVGEAIMLRDEDSGEQVWTWVDTGKPCRHSLYGWMHLPSPLSSPVLSDLRPDGFDGPTGAE